MTDGRAATRMKRTSAVGAGHLPERSSNGCIRNPRRIGSKSGCGTGALTSTICELCKPASVIACDPSEPFIAHARTNLSDARASFVVAGAEALPHREGGFDAVVQASF